MDDETICEEQKKKNSMHIMKIKGQNYKIRVKT